MKLTSITFLLLFSASIFGQSDNCLTCRSFSQLFLIEKDFSGNYIDFKKLFPPEKIKGCQINELNYSVSFVELKWKRDEMEAFKCFPIAFKFNEDGFVSEINFDFIPSVIWYQYLFEYQDGLMKSSKKIESFTYPTGPQVKEYRKKYFYVQKHLLEKIEHYGMLLKNFPDSLTKITNLKYDSNNRLILEEEISTHSSENSTTIWKTTYDSALKKSQSTVHIDRRFIGNRFRDYDKNWNILIEKTPMFEVDSTITKIKYNEFNQIKKWETIVQPDPEEMVCEYKYSESNLFEELIIYFDKIKIQIKLN